MKANLFAKIKQEVFSRQKVLSQIYQNYGHKTLSDYVSAWQIPPFLPESAISKLLENGLTKVYGKTLAKDVAVQFKSSGLVSTIDHHGLFGHPFFLSSNLFFAQRSDIKYLLVFSTSGVSLNNSSWPGCLVLTHPQTRKLIRLSLFKDGHKTKTVFKSQKIDPSQISKVLKQIGNLDFLEQDSKNKLVSQLEKIFFSPEVANLHSFSDQACLISHKLWQATFPNAPQLIYLPLEDLVSEIIADFVCADAKNVLYRLFFTQDGWALLEKYFFGVRGAFGSGRGSFLFWGVDKLGRRVALENRAGRLIGPGTEFELTPGAVLKALRGKEIYPTSLVCFLTMLLYRVTCVGGFNQTTWLTEIKQRFLQLLEEVGEAEAAKKVEAAVTDNFAEGGLAFLKKGTESFKASGLDLFSSQNNFEIYTKLAKQITLAQSIESELPEIYRIVVPEQERQTELAALSLNEIIELNGLKGVLED